VETGKKSGKESLGGRRGKNAGREGSRPDPYRNRKGGGGNPRISLAKRINMVNKEHSKGSETVWTNEKKKQRKGMERGCIIKALVKQGGRSYRFMGKKKERYTN